jgi:hypothetical protein
MSDDYESGSPAESGDYQTITEPTVDTTIDKLVKPEDLLEQQDEGKARLGEEHTVLDDYINGGTVPHDTSQQYQEAGIDMKYLNRLPESVKNLAITGLNLINTPEKRYDKMRENLEGRIGSLEVKSDSAYKKLYGAHFPNLKGKKLGGVEGKIKDLCDERYSLTRAHDALAEEQGETFSRIKEMNSLMKGAPSKDDQEHLITSKLQLDIDLKNYKKAEEKIQDRFASIEYQMVNLKEQKGQYLSEIDNIDKEIFDIRNCLVDFRPSPASQKQFFTADSYSSEVASFKVTAAALQNRRNEEQAKINTRKDTGEKTYVRMPKATKPKENPKEIAEERREDIIKRMAEVSKNPYEELLN